MHRQHVCVPIEPVIPNDKLRDNPKHQHSKNKMERYVKSLDPRSFVYKRHALKCDQSSFARRVYIDIGANSYSTSIGFWFLMEYPDREKFDEIVAFEADVSHLRSYTRACLSPRTYPPCDKRVSVMGLKDDKAGLFRI